MEKFCKSCGKIFEDVNYKYCPDCKTAELIVNYPRQNIIDECQNQIVELTDELEDISNQIQNLKNSNSTDFDEMIENEFLISQLKEKYNSISDEISIYKSELRKEKEIKDEVCKKNQENEKLYMRLHVELDDETLLRLCNNFSISKSSKEESLNELINNYSQNTLLTSINKIKKDLQEEAEERQRKEFYDRLYGSFTDHEISLFARFYPVPCARPDVINYLVDNFSEDEIEFIKLELYKKEKEEEQNRIEEEKRRIEEQKRIEKEKLEKRKKDLSKKFNNEFDTYEDIFLISKYSKIKFDSKEELLNYCVDLTDEEIDNLIKNTRDMIKKDLIKEVESFNLKQCMILANYFSLDSYYKKDLLAKLEEDCSISEIRNAIKRVNN